MSIHLISYMRLFVTIAVLSILSIQDVKNREISSTLVYSYLGFSIVVFIIHSITNDLSFDLKLFYSLVSFASTTGVFLALYFVGLVGDGDVYVSSALGICFTYPDAYTITIVGEGVFPPPLIIILYSTSVSLLLMISYLITNIFKNRDEIRRVPFKYRLILPLVAKAVKIGDYIEGKYKYFYPLEILRIDAENKLSTEFRLFVELREDYRMYLKDLVRKGLIHKDDRIWVTYGLPMILYMYIGFILFVLLGDRPLLILLLRIFRT